MREFASYVEMLCHHIRPVTVTETDILKLIMSFVPQLETGEVNKMNIK